MQWLTCAFSCTMTVHSPSFIHGMLAIYFLSKNVLKIDFWAVLLINSLFKGANVVKYKLENEKEMIRHERNETDILDNNKGNFNIHYISFWSKLKYFLGRHYFVCYDCEQYDEFKIAKTCMYFFFGSLFRSFFFTLFQNTYGCFFSLFACIPIPLFDFDKFARICKRDDPFWGWTNWVSAFSFYCLNQFYLVQISKTHYIDMLIMVTLTESLGILRYILYT